MLRIKNSSIQTLVAQIVKNLPAMLETQVWSLGGKDPLEKEMATHSSILACRNPWTEELQEGYSLWGCKELDLTDGLSPSRPSNVALYAYATFSLSIFSGTLELLP